MKITFTMIGNILRKCIFNPKKDKAMAIIAEVQSVEYYTQHVKVMLTNNTDLATIEMAIKYLAIAHATRQNQAR